MSTTIVERFMQKVSPEPNTGCWLWIGGTTRGYGTLEKWDARRRERLLPLIHAEWARRAQPVPVTFETPAKVEILR